MVCANHPSITEALTSCARCRRLFCPNCLVELSGQALCLYCKGEHVRDLQSGVDAARPALAGIWARFAGQIVDSVAMWVVTVPLGLVAGAVMRASEPDSVTGPIAMCGLYIVIFGVMILYEGLMLQTRGQTLGKMALRLKVISADGADLAPWQAWLRPVIRLLTGGCLIDYIPALFTAEKTCIHDLVCRTRVIRLDS